uniref:Uncharacterized protein n=1 Tax=Caenorhabditis japonica TaxID=281687 RepID=A0A8R1DSX7_CAEJA
MSGQYSDDRFFFAQYGCCIPTESYAWILVVLFVTTIIVLLFCMLSTATIRWMYKRRMRKRLQDLKRKYMQDQFRAQEFDAKLSHLAFAQRSKLASLPIEIQQDNKTDQVSIVMEPTQNLTQKQLSSKIKAKDGTQQKMNAAIYDRDETPKAQSTLASQTKTGHIIQNPWANDSTQENSMSQQLPPDLLASLKVRPNIAPAPQNAPAPATDPVLTDPSIVSAVADSSAKVHPTKKPSPVNSLDLSASEKTKQKMAKLAPPPSSGTTTTSTTTASTTGPVESTPQSTTNASTPAPTTAPTSAPTTAPTSTTTPTSAPSSTVGSTTNQKTAPSNSPAPPSSDNSVSTPPNSTTPATSNQRTSNESFKLQATQSSPMDTKTQSTSPHPKEEDDDKSNKKHRVEYKMNDIVSPHASDREKENSIGRNEKRKEGGGGRGEWKYYHPKNTGSGKVSSSGTRSSL